MSQDDDILDALGIDEDDLEWHRLATCRGISENLQNIFFDDYEVDPVIAEQADNLCLSCPVAKQCLLEGLRTKSYGLWGGIFLDYTGKPSAKFNKHKSEETWKRLAKVHGYKLRSTHKKSV